MITDPHLFIDHLEKGDMAPEEIINAAINRLSASDNGVLSFPVVAGAQTLELDGSTNYYDNGLIVFTGSPGGTFLVIVPDGERFMTYFNDTTGQGTIDTATGALEPIPIAPGFTRKVHAIGTDLELHT